MLEWRKHLGQFANPLIYLLLAAVVVSLVAWRASGVGACAITRRAGKHWALLSVPNDVRAACRRDARYAPR